jgi:hypothetical protein
LTRENYDGDLIHNLFSARPASRAGRGQLRVRKPIPERPRMELISIVAATSVCTPVPVALDVFVEDSHLVGLFVRR